MSERLSVFDMFKVGVGPSSSHTLGPWRAALAFVAGLDASHDLRHVASIRIDFYGALAKTGHGHGTDLAVQAGLLGLDPETCDTSDLQNAVRRIAETHRIEIGGREANRLQASQRHPVSPAAAAAVPPERAHVHRGPGHGRNAGRHVVLDWGRLHRARWRDAVGVRRRETPVSDRHGGRSADVVRQDGLALSRVVWENERAWRPAAATRDGLLRIWHVMQDCIYRGCHSPGDLPGGLGVHRRAPDLEPQAAGKSGRG
jgi:L-serine dehydratase